MFPAPPGFPPTTLSPPCWNVKWPDVPEFNPDDPGPIPEAAKAD